MVVAAWAVAWPPGPALPALRRRRARPAGRLAPPQALDLFPAIRLFAPDLRRANYQTSPLTWWTTRLRQTHHPADKVNSDWRRQKAMLPGGNPEAGPKDDFLRRASTIGGAVLGSPGPAAD